MTTRLVLSRAGRWRPTTRSLKLFTPPAAINPIPNEVLLEAIQDAAAPPSPRPPTTGKSFLGVHIPDKPTPPGPEECCQSGCAICVYDLYLEDSQEYHELLHSAREQIRSKLQIQPKPEFTAQEWPAEIGSIQELTESDSTADGVDPKEKAAAELQRTKQGLDPALRAFLDMEARLKAKAAEKEKEKAQKLVN